MNKIKVEVSAVFIKQLTEKYLKEKKIKEWKLTNNGILEYGNWLGNWLINKTISNKKFMEDLYSQPKG